MFRGVPRLLLLCFDGCLQGVSAMFRVVIGRFDPKSVVDIMFLGRFSIRMYQGVLRALSQICSRSPFTAGRRAAREIMCLGVYV